MSDDPNKFGDEEFIYEKSMEAEPPPKHENNINDGFIIINFEKIPFKRRLLLDKKISVIMPEAFELMSKEHAEIKYPSVNRPDFIYTNEKTTINFMLTHRNDKVPNEEIPKMKDVVQALVMKLYPSSSVIESETIEISGKNLSYFDFMTPTLGADMYNLSFIFSLEGRAVLGACSCPENDMDDWKPVFLQMLGSIEIK